MDRFPMSRQTVFAGDAVMDRIGLLAQVACLWEVTARKPGNVHRYRDFDDATYLDFLLSAAAVAPVLATAADVGIGEAVHEAIRRTRDVAPSNTNLGMVLLLAPLAAVPPDVPLRGGVAAVLDRAGVADTVRVYEAIRLANPSGLGRVEAQDVSEEPTLPLRQVMALTTDRDLVARQYANDFREVFDDALPALVRGLEEAGSLEGAIIFCHLSLMARHPDSLIARKRGPAEAEEASRRARAVLDSGWPHVPDPVVALAELDAWLRAEGRGRNPGTTADLVTAGLFVALRERIFPLPSPHPWTLGAPSDMKNGTLPPSVGQ
jgi:triphosphoribosyl-dephospho-CoA synthase